MGEIAEMMLDGTLCQTCGVYVGSDSGVPTYCEDCTPKKKRKKKKQKKEKP